MAFGIVWCLDMPCANSVSKQLIIIIIIFILTFLLLILSTLKDLYWIFLLYKYVLILIKLFFFNSGTDN